MAYELGNTIEQLPSFTEPISVLSVDIHRDGGGVEVALSDAKGQRLELWFDSRFGRLERLYLQMSASQCSHPIAQNSRAEQDIARWLRQHVEQNYSLEEQKRLLSLDGRLDLHNISKRDHEGYILLKRLVGIEELRKLVIFGIVERS